jgi:hypothetical protein
MEEIMFKDLTPQWTFLVCTTTSLFLLLPHAAIWLQAGDSAGTPAVASSAPVVLRR